MEVEEEEENLLRRTSARWSPPQSLGSPEEKRHHSFTHGLVLCSVESTYFYVAPYHLDSVGLSY